MKNNVLLIIKKISAIVLSCYFLSFANLSYALPFTISPKAGMPFPTQINANTPYIAYYTISNVTTDQRNSNFIKYLPQNVSQITSDSVFFDSTSCDTTFDLAPKGQPGDSCTLQLLIQGAVISNTTPHNMLLACFPNGVTCAGTSFPLNVMQTLDHSHAYYINAGGSAGLTFCDLNMNGSFGACDAISGENLSDPMAITLNSSHTMLYALNGGYDKNVVACPIQADGSVSACTAASLGIGYPQAIAINPKKTVAYVFFGVGNQLSYYHLNADGSVGSVINSTGFFEIDVQGLTINPAGTYLYAASQAGNEICFSPIYADDSLGTCENAGARGLNSPQFIAFNPAGTYAYIANSGSGAVTFCPVNSDGSFEACIIASAGFTDPTSIAFNQAGTYAYVLDQSGARISSCPVRSDGRFGTCSAVLSGINTASGLTLS